MGAVQYPYSFFSFIYKFNTAIVITIIISDDDNDHLLEKFFEDLLGASAVNIA